MAIRWTAEELKALIEEYANAISRGITQLTLEERKEAFLNACLELAARDTDGMKGEADVN